MHTGSVIRRARTEAGLTQRELAARLGSTQPAVARLESPGSNPRIATLERVLEVLGRRLEIGPAAPLAVDVGQLDRHLAMSPRERLRVHDVAARDIALLRGSALRVDG